MLCSSQQLCSCLPTPPTPPLPHFLQVLNDLRWNLVRPQGMEAVMRVRASQGLDITGYTGERLAVGQYCAQVTSYRIRLRNMGGSDR